VKTSFEAANAAADQPNVVVIVVAFGGERGGGDRVCAVFAIVADFAARDEETAGRGRP
jgi:cell division protein FtsI/penicillin-binding protein 2